MVTYLGRLMIENKYQMSVQHGHFIGGYLSAPGFILTNCFCCYRCLTVTKCFRNIVLGGFWLFLFCLVFFQSRLTGTRLPEAELRCWVAHFLCNSFLQLTVRCVRWDRQSHSVNVVDFHYHRICLSSLRGVSVLTITITNKNTFKNKELCIGNLILMKDGGNV